MAMNTSYHDRGMKKWQPFFSSPHLKSSVLANQVAERHAYYMGQVIGRADQFVLIDNSPVEYETIRHVQVYEPTKWWDHA